MPMTLEQVTHEALGLSEDARARLTRTLLESMDAPHEETGVEEAWDSEVARRLEKIKSGATTGRLAADVFGEIRAKYRA